MSFKQERVSMPMASAGIIGFSSDMKIAGIEIDPKSLMIAAFAFVLIVKAVDVILKVTS